jgi:hypothetical protein
MQPDVVTTEPNFSGDDNHETYCPLYHPST